MPAAAARVEVRKAKPVGLAPRASLRELAHAAIAE
jgi:hypothetical protein